jgi:endonuclease G
MAKRKSKKKVGMMGKLWWRCKLLVLLLILGSGGYGVWYSQQDEATQEQSQQHMLSALNWLIERDETNQQVDDVLLWLTQQVPSAAAPGVFVGNGADADRYTFAGLPEANRPLKILKNKGYIVGYDEARQNPAWVAYRLEYEADAGTVKRPHGFKTDRRTIARVRHQDYTNTGYDRGHMAPNYAIGRAHGAKAQIETFWMSNIVPQLPELNRGPWKALEQRIANDYLQHYRELWVITGPIFGDQSPRLDSGVAVPSSFFKILVDVVEPGNVRVLTFTMPQQVKDDNLRDYLTSVDAIEAKTGLDFFSSLNDQHEKRLESRPAKRLWSF